MPGYAPDPAHAAGPPGSDHPGPARPQYPPGPGGPGAPGNGPGGPGGPGHGSGPGGRGRRNLVLGIGAAVVVAALIGGGIWFLTDDDGDDAPKSGSAQQPIGNLAPASPPPGSDDTPGAASPKTPSSATGKTGTGKATTGATGTGTAGPEASSTAGGAAPGAAKCDPAPGAPGKTTYPSAPPMTIDTSAAYTMNLVTSCGTVTVKLNAAKAPTTVNSFAFLAGKNYFDHTPCHRLTTEGIFVLQCGDPTGSGSGGPGYEFADENLAGATYPAGTVAMANSGPGTNGSQFFLVYKDSQLPPQYTPFGTVTGGMEVLEQVAADGVWDGSGDGPPKALIVLDEVTVTKK
ncbi:peptidylprolyl isomerase [Streptodolium elevatio]|uniref:Peptidylprolyl isomerase n=1 Tax=Streptodolium elevatio TaxID=3157996 RepID=A0ABV3DIX9_9ACTN